MDTRQREESEMRFSQESTDPAPSYNLPVGGNSTPSPQADRPLVSRTSILILRAFLIGAVSSRLVNSASGLPVLLAAFLGLVAYFYAGHVRETNRQRKMSLAQACAIMDLESRFSRHVAHIYEPGPHTRSARRRDNEHQYLTVVTRHSGTRL
jgi:hypothetical protein